MLRPDREARQGDSLLWQRPLETRFTPLGESSGARAASGRAAGVHHLVGGWPRDDGSCHCRYCGGGGGDTCLLSPVHVAVCPDSHTLCCCQLLSVFSHMPCLPAFGCCLEPSAPSPLFCCSFLTACLQCNRQASLIISLRRLDYLSHLREIPQHIHTIETETCMSDQHHRGLHLGLTTSFAAVWVL